MDSPSPKVWEINIFLHKLRSSVVNKNRNTAQSCIYCICYLSGPTEQSILNSLLCLALDKSLNHPYQLICWLFALVMPFVSGLNLFLLPQILFSLFEKYISLMCMWTSNIEFYFKIGLCIISLGTSNYLVWLVHCIEMIKLINIFFISSYLWANCHDNSKCISAIFFLGMDKLQGARLSTIIPLLTKHLLTTKISVSTLMSILSLKCHLFNLMELFLFVCCYLSYNTQIQFIWFILCLWQCLDYVRFFPSYISA